MSVCEFEGHKHSDCSNYHLILSSHILIWVSAALIWPNFSSCSAIVVYYSTHPTPLPAFLPFEQCQKEGQTCAYQVSASLLSSTPTCTINP